jgi:hypothetical protein
MNSDMFSFSFLRSGSELFAATVWSSFLVWVGRNCLIRSLASWVVVACQIERGNELQVLQAES